MEKLIEKINQLTREIEEHFGMSAYEVACDKKLSKDPFFVERDREIDRLNAKADTECF